ncbi:MAG: hypothetical protein GX625_19155 [Clostridiaceae bacterium]|jgi:hypothetical protein|nr:hypothetical protein [Clostridiaceae bacterium]
MQDDHYDERLSLGFRMLSDDFGVDDDDEIPQFFDGQDGDEDWLSHILEGKTCNFLERWYK